eukprot:Plantae.Rhodophyta-Rhodochaete_pulchella.ctg5690.p1 GENE.Plantae.Rhodophyta-Rhodochaete_pulchella.ctg5690~~Plantae.Rhodophyta-Rhodochaete_pulchella.ctg5690.p1  ORF type:complete len:288 (+),score=9.18 Plantae.Rhodophyta-Rhodochaete_pulchella.ctg5690:319-1182(+)
MSGKPFRSHRPQGGGEALCRRHLRVTRWRWRFLSKHCTFKSLTNGRALKKSTFQDVVISISRTETTAKIYSRSSTQNSGPARWYQAKSSHHDDFVIQRKCSRCLCLCYFSALPRLVIHSASPRRNAHSIGATTAIRPRAALPQLVRQSVFRTRCMLKQPNSNGTLLDATSIFHIENMECVKSLRRYARFNATGRITVNSVKNAMGGDKQERLKIDYLLYSLCEECCDCIPQGSPQTATGTVSLARGICPAHAHFDVCRIHSKMKWIVKGKNTVAPNLNKLREIRVEF